MTDVVETALDVPSMNQTVFPSGFRFQVGSVAQGYHAQPFPCCTGIKHAVTRRTSFHGES